MKNEKLLDVIGQVKEEFIEEAAPKKEAEEETKKKKSFRPWLAWTALAACAVLVIGFGVPRLFTGEGKDKLSSWPEEEYSGDTMIDELLPREDTAKDTAKDFTTVLPESEQWISPDWGVVLRAKDVTPAGLTLICTQEGGNPTGEIVCGTDYYLSVKNGEIWESVSAVIENYAWDGIAYPIEEGKDRVFEISWEWLYGKLPAGTYRLTKGFLDFRGTGDYDTGKYWVEFEIAE